LGSQFKVHPIQIAKWRKSALEQLPELFVDGRTRQGRTSETDSDALYEEIGRLKVELDWLKKKSACSSEEMRPLVERDHREISVRRQFQSDTPRKAGGLMSWAASKAVGPRV
ncbi:MAG: hypothetical protein ACREQC_15645, partial [Candidatus Binataceae bacterium]